MNKDFSRKINELRESHKMTQQDLAIKLNTTATAVSYWESGRSLPNFNTLKKIASLFNVSLDYLLKNQVNDERKEKDFTTRFEVLFRKGEKLPEEKKELLFEVINSTINSFVKNSEDEKSKL